MSESHERITFWLHERMAREVVSELRSIPSPAVRALVLEMEAALSQLTDAYLERYAD